MIVIKVGGSLFDRPSLRDDLRAYLAPFDESRVELVAGGGHSAEAVRTYDRIHRLGEETSHHLAVQSLVVAEFAFLTPAPSVDLKTAFPEPGP
jgi:aspartokinase-like uncharacterized kinase